MTQPEMRTVSRRALLAAGAAGTAVATWGCSPDNEPTSPPSSGGSDNGQILPDFIRYDGPEPDLPGDAESGVPDGYLAYPDPPPNTGQVPLGLSAPVSIMVQGSPPQTSLANNKWWQQLNTEIGAEITSIGVPSAQYTANFQTAVAGDDLGDLTQIIAVPQLPAMLESRFTDLTPYLAGDKIAQYPNLANLPPASWQAGVFAGQLWGVPQARIPGGTVLMTNGDILDSHGIDLMPQLASGEDFLEMCREVNDPDNNVFAFGHAATNWTVPLVLEALGGPVGWRVTDDGDWIHAYETPEYERAIEIVAGMYQEGLYHPNSYSDLGSSGPWFDAGTTVFQSLGFANWQTQATRQSFDVGVVAMPQWEGGGPAPKHLSGSAYAWPVGLSKTDDEGRIDELLRLLDYIASPFGTREFLHVNYGVEDRQWELQAGELTMLPDAPQEAISGLSYAGSPRNATLYVPGGSDVTQRIHQWCTEHIPTGVADPSSGLYSETNLSKSAAARRNVEDVIGAIIQGRSPLTAWPNAVAAWMKAAGDAMAEEFAEAAS